MNSNRKWSTLHVYMKTFYSSVDLIFCQLYLDLRSWRLPSTVVSVNNGEGAPWRRNHEICKTRGNLRSAIN